MWFKHTGLSRNRGVSLLLYNMSIIWKAKSKEGFCVKLLSELLSNISKFPPFKVSDRGLFLRTTDQAREILIDLALPRENFTVFKCPKPLYFIVNSGHFYRLLKTIKKKDAVTMFINEHRPMQLGICVEQNDEKADKVITYINITYVQPEEIDLPEGYENPIIVTAKSFQKLKTLHSIGAEMKVTVVGNSSIKCFVNGKDLFSREICLGEETDEDTDEEEDSRKIFTQTLATSHITQLTKCAGQSGNIQVFHHDELPLQIKMRTGTLGTLTVYIKSKELIDQLEEEPDEVEDELEGISGGVAKIEMIGNEPETEENEAEVEEPDEEEAEAEEEIEEEVEAEALPPSKKKSGRHH